MTNVQNAPSAEVASQLLRSYDDTEAITRLAPQRRAGTRPAASRAAQLPAGTGHLFLRSFRGTVSWGPSLGQGHGRTDRDYQDSERLLDRAAAGDEDLLVEAGVAA